ncbi:polymorphic toxin type 23 domain-containing protein, partial [Capnocytophaga periodontitidis]|uniref:polymorphic toxin type 23 domain-containing protein n=1 Tax=Capnocytophaga periodontitidis TaxID=2795027 RepID=UPI0021D33AE5
AEKLLTQIDNENQDGNRDHYTYTYDHNRQLLTSSETNPWAKYTKAYTYDLFGRVQKEMTTAEAAGKRASAVVQYRYQNGELVEMKDDKGVTLWKLSSENPYGQPLISHKGNVKETYTYDKGFPVSQLLQSEDKAIGALTWQFNLQKGLLDSRQYSFWGKQEDFTYDNLDRLMAWGDANTPPQTHSYDERGRITENSLLGTYKYPSKGYDQEKLQLNDAGEAFYKDAPMPVIRYNMLKNPEQIYIKDKERITYLYNAFGNRAHSFYGNAEAEKEKRPIHKHYSADGSVEIKEDKTKGSIDFLFYLGGDPYSAPAILISDGETQKLYYLHRDYLGSIVMLTDENGNIAERRHFDPWGQPIKVEDGAGNTLDKLTLLDRGFTGHEHLQTVGLINMNARLYDPALHRFLQPDNYVQDPFNTQNFNRYGYCLNNPLLYTDPNGEFVWAAVVIGAIIGASSYAVSAAINDSWSWGSFGLSVLGGAVGGAITGALGSTAVLTTESIANGIATGAVSSMLPSVNFPIGDWNISLSLAVAFGNASGMGANFAVGYNDGNWGFSAGVGIMAYNNYYGFGKNAIEVRNSIMASWDDGTTGVSLGTNAWSGDFSQRTGIIGFRSGDFKLMYENDGAPFNKLGKILSNNTDMYRTAAASIEIGKFSLQTNLFTGKSGTDESGKPFKQAIKDPNLVDFSSGRKGLGIWKNKEADMYRLGALTIGYGGWRVGTNSEHIRDAVQNWFAHKIISPQPGFRMLDTSWNGFYQYQTRNSYTLW